MVFSRVVRSKVPSPKPLGQAVILAGKASGALEMGMMYSIAREKMIW